MFRLTCGDCRLLSLLQAGPGCGLHPAFPAPSVFLRVIAEARLGHPMPRECDRLQYSTVMPRAGGASSIPEASHVNPVVSGILDRPGKPGDDTEESCLITPREARFCHRLLPFANLFARNSASTSTRAGRGPPGGVTRCTAPSGCFQSFRITSTAPEAMASPTMKSGRSAMPSPAVSSGMTASPLLTRNWLAGRTL